MDVDRKAEEKLEEGGIGDVLTQKHEVQHKYTRRQKASLILGILLFFLILLSPVPSTFVESALKNTEIPEDVLSEAVRLGFVEVSDGKLSKVKDLEGMLSLLEERAPEVYKKVTKKAEDMKSVTALTILMAVWWIGEAIPLPATALLPLVVLPVLGVSKINEVAPSYASKVIFLFMGGFMIAAAMMKWNLHRRLALVIVSKIGTSPKKLVLGFMVATAFLSMWISNTATTMMMMPIGLSVILHVVSVGERLKREGKLKEVDFRAGRFKFGTSLMLGIAYAASIGGVATIIGTPPNAVFVGTLPKLFPNSPEVTFTDWLAIGLPISIIMLFTTWFILVYLLNKPEIDEIPGGRELIKRELEKLGPWSKGEKIVLLIFVFTALAWINSKPKNIAGITIPGISSYLPFVNDYVIAMAAAIALFLIPVNLRKGEFALDWDHAKDIPWGILLLFGGGIALSKAFTKSGLANWLAEQLLFLKGVPTILVILAVVTLVIFLTEMTSNTAIATLMMPIMAGFALAMGEDPRAFMIPATIAASFAFMLPVATPPNAIVFGTGYITIPQMVRNGILLNVVGIVLVTLLCYLLLPAVFGLEWGVKPEWVP